MGVNPNEKNELLRGRILNWKFRSAVEHLDGAKNDETHRFVEALAAMFENEGWMSGLMAEVIEAAVNYIYVLEGWEVEGTEGEEKPKLKPAEGPNAEAVQSLRELAAELISLSKELEDTKMPPLEATKLVGKTLISIGEELCGRPKAEGGRIPVSQYNQCKDCKGTAGDRNGNPGSNWKCCPPLCGPCTMYEKES